MLKTKRLKPRIITLVRRSLSLCLILCPGFVYGANLEDNFYRQVPFSDSKLKQQHDATLRQFDRHAVANAKALSTAMMTNVSKALKQSLLGRSLEDQQCVKNSAKAIANAGLIHAIADDKTTALKYLHQAVAALSTLNPYHRDLFPMLMSQAITQRAAGDYIAANDTLRRAQHISHRYEGVLGQQQIPVLEELVALNLKQRRPYAADQQQRLNLRVREERFGQNSEELVPSMVATALYFAKRGDSIPIGLDATNRLHTDTEEYSLRENQPRANMLRNELFRDANRLLKRAIHIIEDKYGNDDLRLVTPLQGMAYTRFLKQKHNHQARAAIEQAHNIVSAHPNSSPTDIARSLVARADLYRLTDDDQALEDYQDAYQMLSDSPARLAVRDELFQRNVRLFPKELFHAAIPHQPTKVDQGVPLQVEITFDISSQGVTKNLEIKSGNVAKKIQRLTKVLVARMIFRPRFENSHRVETKDITFKQGFSVVKRVKTIGVSIGPR